MPWIRKLRIRLEIEFETAWRIGSNREGEAGADLGVLRSPDGRPVLPGSSLKGKLRSTCERIAPHLGLTACCLDYTLSRVTCVSDVKDQEVRRSWKEVQGTEKEPAWAQAHTCDVCKLFGSPAMGGRLALGDGRLVSAEDPIVQVRDGVVIDRDAGSARDGLKYDYEVTQPDVSYRTDLDIEDPSDVERALLGAALLEWEDGVALGGATTRGLGRARTKVAWIREIDLSRADDRRRYLLERAENRWRATGGDPGAELQRWVEHSLQALGER